MFATIHSWWTVGLLIAFVGIVIWAFSSARTKDFDEAARLALDEDDINTPPVKGERHG